MASETPSPPPNRSAPRSNAGNGPARGHQTRRDLSPWSARRAMTLAHSDTSNRPTPRRSKSRDKPSHNGSSTKDERPPNPPRDRSRERESRHSRDKSREPKTSVKDSSPPPPRAHEAPSGSPDPYRPSRDQSRHRKRDVSKDRKRDYPRERHRDRSKDRKRDRSRERHRDRSRDRRRDRSKEKKRDRSRSRDRKKDRSRSRDRKRRERSNRSASPLPYRSRKERSRSRSPKRRRRTPASPSPQDRSRKPLPSQEVSFRGLDDSEQAPTKYGGAPTDREKPNFKTTGLLAKDANKVEGTKISLKYHEPPEARKPPPSAPWRLFIFKGADTLGTIELHTQSCWLLGRAKEVADIPLEHPSSSSQHAAIQFRYIQKTVEDEYGVRTKKGKVKPYVIDLESSNGTELNDEELEGGRYYELRDKDILRFGGSEREYVIMLPPKE